MVDFLANGLGIGYLEFYSSGYIPYFSAGIATYYAWSKLKGVAPKKILQVLSLLLMSLYIAAQAGAPYISLCTFCPCSWRLAPAQRRQKNRAPITIANWVCLLCTVSIHRSFWKWPEPCKTSSLVLDTIPI